MKRLLLIFALVGSMAAQVKLGGGANGNSVAAGTIFGNFTTSTGSASFTSFSISGSKCYLFTGTGGQGCDTPAGGGAVTSVNTLTGAVVVEAATAGQVAISGGSAAALTGAADLTYSTHTFSTASTGIFDFSAATGTAALKVPQKAGDTATASGAIDFDTTNSNYHGFMQGADALFVGEAASLTAGTIPKAGVANSSLIAASALDDGATTASTLTYTGTGGISASSGFKSTADGTHPGIVSFAGNTTLPSLPSSTVSIVGPPSATPTAWSLQLPTAIPTTGDILSVTVTSTNALMTDSGVVASNVVTAASNYTSGQFVKAAGNNKTTSSAAIATTDVPAVNTVVDTSTPVTVSTTNPAEYHFNENATAGTAVTYNLPTAAAGKQFCFSNAYNGTAANTGILTIATSATGQFIIFTDGTLSATGGNVTSGGAAADASCVVGVDSTHWMLYVQRGTWTKH